jgi:ornithine cyclodeaminase/alanine dehydrogenase-like protein (mu-crystallin family)
MTTVEPGRLLYLSRDEVAAVGPSMTEIVDALEQAFREKGAGGVEMPPKPGIHPGGGDNFIHAMPAYIPALGAAGMKWVSGFPGNAERGLPHITGLLVLNDVETGVPLAVMDCTWITAMRTGAATAVAARYLARPDSTVLGVLGCGVQGRTNLEALRVVLPIRRVLAFDTRREVAERYAVEMAEEFGLDVAAVATPREAVAGCDVVVTAGPILREPHATIQPGWLERGAFASLVDFDSYWHPDAMRECAKFCTDDLPQLLHYCEVGYFRDIPDVYADLGELVTGAKPGRENVTERTMTCNLGIAMDDMAVAPLVYRRALEAGAGTWLPL